MGQVILQVNIKSSPETSPPPVDLTMFAACPTNRSRIHLALAAMPVVLAVLAIWQMPDRINHDCALYLQEAELLLDGAMPYRDFVETNPPLAIYLNVVPAALARASGLPPIVVFQATIVALLALATAEMFVVVRPSLRTPVLAAWLVFALMVDWIGDVGQREHLFVLLYLPYFFLRIGRSEGRRFAGWFAVALGIQAGVGASLKPHFLLIAAAVEAAFFTFRGRRRFVRQPEVVAIAAVVVVYAAHWLLAPAAMREAYFQRWMPLMCRGYAAYDVGMTETARKLFGSPISLVGLVGVLAATIGCLRRRVKQRRFLAATAACGVAALAMVFVQHKGWTYHFLPFQAAGLLAAGALLSLVLGKWNRRATHSCRDQRPSPPRLLRMVRSSWSRVFLCCLLAGFVAAWFIERPNMAKVGALCTSALGRLIERYTQPGDRVLVVATSVWPTYPMLLRRDRRPGSRYLVSFPIAMFYFGETCSSGRFLYHEGERMSAEERRFLEELREDVECLRPRLLIVSAAPDWQGLPQGFNVHGYLCHAGWESSVLKSYRPIPALRDWRAFVRTDR